MTEYPIIRFEDVRVGDTVSATLDGVSHSGIVGRITQPNLYTSEGGYISNRLYVIRLVDRPKPALPTEPGSVIIATEVRGEAGRWHLIRCSNGAWVSTELISGFRFHVSIEVTAWLPAEIREVEA